MGLVSWVKLGYQEIFKSPSLWSFASIIDGPKDSLLPHRCLCCNCWVRRDVWRVKRWGNWPMRNCYVCLECALTKKDARRIFDRWESMGL